MPGVRSATTILGRAEEISCPAAGSATPPMFRLRKWPLRSRTAPAEGASFKAAAPETGATLLGAAKAADVKNTPASVVHAAVNARSRHIPRSTPHKLVFPRIWIVTV